MGKSGARIKTVVLSLVWLVVVFGAVVLAITRREQYGFVSYIVVGMAVGMLVLFVLNHLPRRRQEKPSTETVGKLSVGFLILLIILLLASVLVKSYKTLGILGSGVLVLFLITFVRIFRDYLRDFIRQYSKRKPPREEI